MSIRRLDVYDILNTNLLRVVLPQLNQLLTLVVLDAVQHRINLYRFCLRPVISVAQRAAIHANQFNDTESDEDLSDDLENQRQNQKAKRTYRAGDERIHLDMVEHNWIDE